MCPISEKGVNLLLTPFMFCSIMLKDNAEKCITAFKKAKIGLYQQYKETL